jgi:uncharacterized protein YjbI with pentapeptide repeats
MQYTPPGGYTAIAPQGGGEVIDDHDSASSDVQASPVVSSESSVEEHRAQELHVRSAAQNVLAGLLRLPVAPDNADRPTLDLDLAGAVLINCDLSGCRAGNATFVGARFGYIDYGEGAGSKETSFVDAVFYGEADFRRASFSVSVDYRHGTFDRTAQFTGSVFVADAWYSDAVFKAGVDFGQAAFLGTVRFDRATLSVFQ